MTLIPRIAAIWTRNKKSFVRRANSRAWDDSARHNWASSNIEGKTTVRTLCICNYIVSKMSHNIIFIRFKGSIHFTDLFLDISVDFSWQNFPGLSVLLCISLLLSSINVNISVWCGWCGNYLPFTLQTLGNFKIFVMFSLTPHYKCSSHKRHSFILTVAVSSLYYFFGNTINKFGSPILK